MSPMAIESQISAGAQRAVMRAPALNVARPSGLHLPRSHSMPSVLTANGVRDARSSGSQKPLAMFNTNTASNRRKSASTVELSP